MHPDGSGAAAEPARAQRTTRVALAAALVGIGLWTVHSFLPALLWAGIFAIALHPFYQRVRRRWPARGHGVALPAVFTLAVALVFILPLALAAVQLGREAFLLLQWAREGLRTGLPLPDWIAGLPFAQAAAAEWWQDNLGSPEAANEFLGRMNQTGVVAYGREFGAQLAHRAVLFGFTLLALFFLFRDGTRFAAQILAAGRRAFGPRGERLLRQTVASVHGTVDGLVLVGIGEGVVLGVAYALAGVPHPTLLGALTALAAMVPFAAPLVFGAAALLLVAQGSAAAAAAVFGLGMAVLFVADHMVRPALIGGATRLPFLLVLIGILGGVETWGLLGLFVGPASMAVLTLLWRDWVEGAEANP